MKFKEASEDRTLPKSDARDLVEEFEASGLRCAVVDYTDTYTNAKQARACLYNAAKRYTKTVTVKQRDNEIFLVNEGVEKDVF